MTVKVSNSVYDLMKFFVQIVLPALGVLYASLAGFWGFPNVEEVVGTVTAVALFLGAVMRLSSKNYNVEGSPVGSFLVIDNEEGGKTISLGLDQDPADFVDGSVISFKLVNETRAENSD